MPLDTLSCANMYYDRCNEMYRLQQEIEAKEQEIRALRNQFEHIKHSSELERLATYVAESLPGAGVYLLIIEGQPVALEYAPNKTGFNRDKLTFVPLTPLSNT